MWRDDLWYEVEENGNLFFVEIGFYFLCVLEMVRINVRFSFIIFFWEILKVLFVALGFLYDK